MKRYCALLVLAASLLLTVAPAPVNAGGQPVVQPGRAWGNPSSGWNGPAPGVRDQPSVFGTHRDPWAQWPPRRDRDFDRPRDGGDHDGFGHPGMRHDVVWVPGFWGWTAYGWAWVPGHWAVAR